MVRHLVLVGSLAVFALFGLPIAAMILTTLLGGIVAIAATLLVALAFYAAVLLVWRLKAHRPRI